MISLGVRGMMYLWLACYMLGLHMAAAKAKGIIRYRDVGSAIADIWCSYDTLDEAKEATAALNEFYAGMRSFNCEYDFKLPGIIRRSMEETPETK